MNSMNKSPFLFVGEVFHLFPSKLTASEVSAGGSGPVDRSFEVEVANYHSWP
jgi:hypothetical protein